MYDILGMYVIIIVRTSIVYLSVAIIPGYLVIIKKKEIQIKLYEK
jgi:hypothetical protein